MRKKIAILLVLLMAIVIPVNAKSMDAFKADENLKLEKEMNSTTFAAGQKVDITSKIKGIIFAAGQKVRVAGENDYSFIAGQDVVVSEITTRDAFVAGQDVTIEKSSIRDLFVAAETVTINSDISRNVFVGGDKVIISGKINGDVNVAAETVIVQEGAEITGTLNLPKEAKLTKDGATINKVTTYKSESSKEVKETTIVSEIMTNLVACLAMMILGFIGLFLFKGFFNKVAEFEKSPAFLTKYSIFGLIELFAIPVCACIVLLISFMALMIPFPIVVIGLILYGLMIYLSAIPTAYYLGNWFLKDKVKNEYGIMALMILALYVARMIPVLGGLIGLITVCFGLAIYVKMMIPAKKEK